MFDFSTFVEHWATIYKPMLHDPEPNSDNRRFFPCEGIDSIPALIQNFPSVQSPIVLVESDIEGKMDDRFMNSEYHVYLLCRDPDGMMNSGRTAKREAAQHLEKFIDYLKNHADRESPNFIGGLQQLSTSEMQYYSINLFNDWYGIQLDMVNVEPFRHLLSADDYVEGSIKL